MENIDLTQFDFSQVQEDPVLEKEIMYAIRRAELIKMEAAINNPQLIGDLKEWRRARAEAEDVPQYIVLNNRTLLEIAQAAPTSMEGLLTVPGFGPQKAEKYGSEILEILAG